MKSDPNVPKVCKDCGKSLDLSTRYLVRVPVKPKGARNRWKHVGYQCEDCEGLKK